MNKPLWETRSKPGTQALLALVCAGVGLILVAKFWSAPDQAISEARAVIGLGGLLFAIGFGALVTAGRQTVIVDPGTQRIIVEDVRLAGATTRTIPFGDIVDIRIGYLGKASSYVTFYYLVLLLKGGEEYPLFSPGRGYDGGTDRFVAEGRRRRLAEYLRRE